MWYLFFQVWILLLISFVLGWCAHWFFCCRGKEDAVVAQPAVVPQAGLEPEPAPVDLGSKPLGLTSPPESVDDLKRIKGVGNVIEKTLNELGTYRFDQIADWSSDNVAWVENHIAFPGRISREDWVGQARTLGAGGTTDFAKRVDEGEMDYKD